MSHRDLIPVGQVRKLDKMCFCSLHNLHAGCPTTDHSSSSSSSRTKLSPWQWTHHAHRESAVKASSSQTERLRLFLSDRSELMTSKNSCCFREHSRLRRASCRSTTVNTRRTPCHISGTDFQNKSAHVLRCPVGVLLLLKSNSTYKVFNGLLVPFGCYWLMNTYQQVQMFISELRWFKSICCVLNYFDIHLIVLQSFKKIVKNRSNNSLISMCTVNVITVMVFHYDIETFLKAKASMQNQGVDQYGVFQADTSTDY